MYIALFYMHECVYLHVIVSESAHHVHTHGDQKRISDSLELGLESVVSCLSCGR